MLILCAVDHWNFFRNDSCNAIKSIGFNNIRIRPSTRFQIVCGFKNFHPGERIQIVADSHASSPDTCGRKANLERKSCGFKYIRIRADGALIYCFVTLSLTFQSSLLKLSIMSSRADNKFIFLSRPSVCLALRNFCFKACTFHPPQIFLRKIKGSEVSFFEVDYVLPWFTHTLHFAADCAQITGKLRTD